MKFISAAVLAVALLLVAPQSGARDRAASPAVTRWIELELAEIASHRTNPPRAARGLAITSVAMRDATRLPRAQRRAAVAGAASTVLAYLYPDRAAFFEELAERERPRIGVVRGRLIGKRVVARARRDGSDAVFQGPIPEGPALWVPNASGFPAAARAARGHLAPVEHLFRLAVPPRPAARRSAVAGMPARCVRSMSVSRALTEETESESPTSGPTARLRRHPLP